jgi:hypothetical protein
MPERTCSECNAQYNSESELRAHMGAVHRKFNWVQSSPEPSDTLTEGSSIQSQEQLDH